MKNEPSPRPWRVEQPGDECRFWTIRNPDGISVCTAWREDDAALIVDAVNEYARHENWRKKYIDRRVNDAARIEGLFADISDLGVERDRLLDLVRRLACVAQDALDLAKVMCDNFGDNPERAKARSEIEALLREARVAIGEDAP